MAFLGVANNVLTIGSGVASAATSATALGTGFNGDLYYVTFASTSTAGTEIGSGFVVGQFGSSSVEASGVVKKIIKENTGTDWAGGASAFVKGNTYNKVGTFKDGQLVLEAPTADNKLSAVDTVTLDTAKTGVDVTTINTAAKAVTIIGGADGHKLGGGEGKTTYKLSGSGATITDAGGEDTYNFLTASAGTNLTLTDTGADKDVYTFAASSVGFSITDGGGANEVSFAAKGSGSISVEKDTTTVTLKNGSNGSNVKLAGAASYNLTVNSSSTVTAADVTGTGKLAATIAADYATVTGTAQADTFVINRGTEIKLAGDGADSVTVAAAAHVNASALAGGATFTIQKSGATVLGGKGNDLYSLTAGVKDVFISGTTGAVADEGTDTLNVAGTNSVSLRSTYIDKINITGDQNTIDASGNQAAATWNLTTGEKNQIMTGANGDTVSVSGGSNNSIYGNSAPTGLDKVTIAGGDVALGNLEVASGKDEVAFTAPGTTVVLTSGFTANSLKVDQVGTTIKTDKLFNGTKDNTIIDANATGFTFEGTGNGAVTLNINETGAKIKTGDGNDVVNLNKTPDAITAGKGKDTYNVNTVMTTTIEHGDNQATININDDADGANITGPSKFAATYLVKGDNVTLQAGSKADTIDVNADGASINAGGGDDSINAQSGTILAGTGNDSVAIDANSTAKVSLGSGKDTLAVGDKATVTVEDLSTSDDDQIVFYKGNGTVAAAAATAVDGTDGSTVVTFYSDANKTTVIGVVESKNPLNAIKEIKANNGATTINKLLGDAALPGTQDTVLPAGATSTGIDLSQLNGGKIGYAYVNASGVYTGTEANPEDKGLGVVTTPYVYVADANAKPTVPIDASGADNAWNITGSKSGEVIRASAHGDTINGNGGGDSIIGGAGADYVVAHNGDKVYLGADSAKDTVDATKMEANGNFNVGEYVYSDDVIKVADATAVTVDTTNNGVLKATNADGKEFFITSDSIQANGYWAHVTDDNPAHDDKDIAWVDKDNAGYLNGSSYSVNLTMYGTANELANSLEGGAGRDTIFGSAGDSIYGGAGNDSIKLEDTKSQREEIGLTKVGGVDTVVGFEAGFNADNDMVTLMQDERGAAGAKIDNNGQLVVGDGEGQLIFDNVATQPVQAGDGGNGLASYFLAKDKDGAISKVAVGNKGAVISKDTVTGAYADVYTGESGVGGTTVDFTDFNTELAIDLGNTGSYGDRALKINFAGITNVKGAKDQRNSIIGSAGMEDSIVGGANGHNSMWGGGISNDVLVGQADSDDYFYYGNGEGHDSLVGFTVGNNSQSDKVVLFSGYAAGAQRKIDSNGTHYIDVSWSDGEVLTLTQTTTGDVNDLFKYGTYGQEGDRYVKVGYADSINSFAYDAAVNEYYGNSDDSAIGNNDILTVGAETTAARIYLEGMSYDGAVDTKYRGITNINASASKGALELGGSQLADSIVGGAGQNSIWGGSSAANDTLVGGTGKNTFYYGVGEGNDTIVANSGADKVVLYNVNYADIASTALDASGNFVATGTNGATITIQNIQEGFQASFADRTVTYKGGTFV